MQIAWLISIGTELSLGQTVDTNAAWIAQRLSLRGIRAVRHITVPDELGDILGVLVSAVGACDLVVITGGLGPTNDDLTRQALADAAGVPLEQHADSVERIRRFFEERNRPMHESNHVQALLPMGADVLPNSCGTAPGVYLKLSDTPVFALPGVPSEMRAMFDHEVAPRLPAGERVILQRLLHCVGEGESAIGAKIRDLMERGHNPEVGTTAQSGIVGIRINASAETAGQAEQMLADVEREVRARLGPLVFGADQETLAGAVGTLLAERGETVAVAESCTGGLIGQMLTDTPGSSRYFVGGVVAYANDVKTALLDVSPAELASDGAVSVGVARSMAHAARQRFGTTYAISATGIAGPDGGTPDKPVGTVFIGLATPAAVDATRFQFGADTSRGLIRQRAAIAALNMLRRAVMDAATVV